MRKRKTNTNQQNPEIRTPTTHTELIHPQSHINFTFLEEKTSEDGEKTATLRANANQQN